MTRITLLVDLPIDLEGKSGWTIDLDKIEYNISVIEKELSIPLMEKFKKRELGEIFAVFQLICFLTVVHMENGKTFKEMILLDVKDDEDEALKTYKSFKSEEDDDIELRGKFMKAFYQIRDNNNEFSDKVELVFFTDGEDE